MRTRQTEIPIEGARGSSICKNGKRKSRCRRCGGSSICEHGKKIQMRGRCRGSSICEHGKQKFQCEKGAGGSSICERTANDPNHRKVPEVLRYANTANRNSNARRCRFFDMRTRQTEIPMRGKVRRFFDMRTRQTEIPMRKSAEVLRYANTTNGNPNARVRGFFDMRTR